MSSNSIFFLLDKDNNVVECKDSLKWMSQFVKGDNVIASSRFKGVLVITLFTGIPQGEMNGERILFSTEVFDEKGVVTRSEAHTSYQEAYQTHFEICKEIFQ